MPQKRPPTQVGWRLRLLASLPIHIANLEQSHPHVFGIAYAHHFQDIDLITEVLVCKECVMCCLQVTDMSMPTMKRAATMRPLTVKSRLHRETSNHSNLDSLLEDISRSQQHKENRCTQAAQKLLESRELLLQLILKVSGLTPVW